MSKKFVEDLLKDMLTTANYQVVRTGLDKQKHLVTMTEDGLTEAFKDAYVKLQTKDNTLPSSRNWRLFRKSARKAISLVKKKAANPKASSITEIAGTLKDDKKITFYVSRGNSKIFSDIKNILVKDLNKKLQETGSSRLTNAYDIKTKSGDPDMSWGAAAKSSQVGQLRSGIEIHHKNLTTVGIAQLNKGLKFLGGTEHFKDFIGEDSVKDLREIFGDFDSIIHWDTELEDFVLTEKTAIEVEIGSYKKNFAGSESTDWKKIKPKLERAVYKYAKKQDWWKLPGSNSLQEDSVLSIGHAVTKTLGEAKNAKVTSTSKKPKRNKKPVKANSGNLATSFSTGTKKARELRETRKKQQTPLNVSYIITVMNQKLSDVVAKNMQDPRLNYRTGRFADSVRVVDAVQTPQGFASFGYTYQKYPYQTFEPGFAQGDLDRDPRKLIDKSMREIAASFAIGRFYTRRV